MTYTGISYLNKLIHVKTAYLNKMASQSFQFPRRFHVLFFQLLNLKIANQFFYNHDNRYTSN